MLAPMILVFPALMTFAAASDLLSMTISNKVPLLLIAGFMLVAAVAGMPIATAGTHVLAGIAVLAVTFGCFAMGWMGGGDAKLMASTALWFGATPDLVNYLLVSAVLGGILTLALVLMRAQVAPVTGVVFLDRLLEPKGGIPYGIALGVGGLIVFADSAWMDLAFAR